MEWNSDDKFIKYATRIYVVLVITLFTVTAYLILV